MNVPAAKANRNRKDFYKGYINRIIQREQAPRITSIASGPAIEIIEVLDENPAAEGSIITCLDFESRALDYVKEQIHKIESKHNKTYKISYINANIMNMLRHDNLEGLIEKQDLIYSSGLIDYFSDKIASKMIEELFDRLKQGGQLIVGNVSAANKHRAYTEILGEWFINHRTEEDMLELTKRIKGKNNIEIKYEAETRMNIFMIISKL